MVGVKSSVKKFVKVKRASHKPQLLSPEPDIVLRKKTPDNPLGPHTPERSSSPLHLHHAKNLERQASCQHMTEAARASRSFEEQDLSKLVQEEAKEPVTEHKKAVETEDGSSIPQELSTSKMCSSASQVGDVSEQNGTTVDLAEHKSTVRLATNQLNNSNILIEEQPLTQISSKVTSGRASRLNNAAIGSSGKAGSSQPGAPHQHSKSIKVPPPTINPYNTMINLKTQSAAHRRESQATSSSGPNSKLSMASTAKLATGLQPSIKVERLSVGNKAQPNERSSTSNSNYYNQTLAIAESASQAALGAKTEKRKKGSGRKKKEASARRKDRRNQTPTRSAKNFSPILQYAKLTSDHQANVPSPKQYRAPSGRP